MQQHLGALVATLREARHFEQAALPALRAALEEARAALDASPFGAHGVLLRALVHLRPEDGYRCLAVLEAGAPGLSADGGPEGVSLLESVTAWRAVSACGMAVALDVTQGEVHGVNGRPLTLGGGQPLTFSSTESRQRFLGRQATHVGAFPLRLPGGALVGMLTVEAECLAAMGQPFVWEACAGALQAVADVAAPSLAVLPPHRSGRPTPDPLLPVVGERMSALLPMLQTFSQQEETLLLSGATGTGKSRLARWCHAQSPRREGPFEVLDLLSVPEELQMAELFGWRKGAFTGAVRDTTGAVRRAEGGTLFIDEVDKLSSHAQAGLLQLLEGHHYRVLGEDGGARRADVRFIVGTNAHLRAEVAAGRFREDLYYRINVLPVRLPTLDERMDEVGAWADYMLQRRHGAGAGTGRAVLTPGAQRVLATSRWPGNLRQLDNIIRRAYSLALMQRSGAGADVVVGEREAHQALSYESTPPQGTLGAQLRTAAETFVQQATRDARPLDLDLADAFRGFVLATAAERWGKEQAFVRLGKEPLVRNRNHTKVWRRELERVEVLLQAAGEPFLFSHLVGAGRDEEP